MRVTSALARNIAVLTVALTLVLSGESRASETVCRAGQTGNEGDDDYMYCFECTEYAGGCPEGSACTEIYCQDNDYEYYGEGCRPISGNCRAD